MNSILSPVDAQNTASEPKAMPDVAATERPKITGALDWVGMAGIALPLRIQDSVHGEKLCQGQAQTYVSLDQPETKGIHMSRLYLLLEEFCQQQALQPQALQTLLQQQLISHEGLSEQSGIRFNFDLYLQRSALKSDSSGWKAYPITLKVKQQAAQSETSQSAATEIELTVTVAYSSTCPCSASLSRQLLEQAMQDAFAGQEQVSKAELSEWLLSKQGSIATPHSQRSLATVTVRLDAQLQTLPVTELIDQIEDALQTPVQTAVKRQDEQEFARLNGQNLMFCEDAARRIRQGLLNQEIYQDFCLKVEHLESLHAHDAVAFASKGIKGGLRADF